MNAPSTSLSLPPPTTTTTRPADPRLLVQVVEAQAKPPGQVLMMRPDGSEVQVVDLAPVREDQVSPDGSKVVYSVDQGSGSYSGCGFAGCSSTYTSAAGIAMASRDGSGQKVLTTGGDDFDPRWSPTGDLIAFTSHVKRPDSTETDTIALMSPEGSVLGDLGTPEGYTDSSPAFSPDGSRLAFLRGHGTEETLEILQIGADQPTPVATGAFSGWITWSPGGSQIATAAKATWSDPAPDRIDVIALGGEAIRTVYTAPPTPQESTERYVCGETVNEWPVVTSPMWSPDGARIAFLSNGRTERDDSGMDVMSVASDGSNLKTVRRVAPYRCMPGQVGRLAETVTLLGWGRSIPANPAP